MPESQYQITVHDGVQPPVQVQMSRPVLSQMIANAILRGVVASQTIEGEGVDVVFTKPVNLPEKLLQTD